MEKQDRERASAPIAQECVRRSSKKKRRDVQCRTGSASLPAPAERLGPRISTVHTNDSHSNQKQRPSCQSSFSLNSEFEESSSCSSSSSSSTNPDHFAIRLSAVRFGYLSEGDFSTDLDLVQEVGRLIRSLSAPATSHQPLATLPI